MEPSAGGSDVVFGRITSGACRSAAEVKREAEGAGGQVRVMTVHGAKGLSASRPPFLMVITRLS